MAGSTKKARLSPISKADTRSSQCGWVSAIRMPCHMNSGAAAQMAIEIDVTRTAMLANIACAKRRIGDLSVEGTMSHAGGSPLILLRAAPNHVLANAANAGRLSAARVADCCLLLGLHSTGQS